MSDPLYWSIAVASAFLSGMAKTSVPGLGVLIVPLIALIFPARESVGALLPLLVLGDLVGVVLFRRHARWKLLLGLAPWTLGGMIAGAWALLRLDDQWLRPGIGALILALVGLEFLRRTISWLNRPHQPWFTGLAGLLTGFTTTVGNVAGPVMNLFLIGNGVLRTEFVGTNSWFFLIVNLSKVPLFVHLGMIHQDTLRFDLWMAPFVILGAWIGRRLLHALSDQWFQTAILVLAALSGLQLLVS